MTLSESANLGEPKEYWFIDDRQGPYQSFDNDELIDEQRKEIGNYFETEEEARKAVKKLKAWKRLKDKGFKFTFVPGVGGLDVNEGEFVIDITASMPRKYFVEYETSDDLDLLFAEEEE